jgi:hypothetical protein
MSVAGSRMVAAAYVLMKGLLDAGIGLRFSLANGFDTSYISGSFFQDGRRVDVDVIVGVLMAVAATAVDSFGFMT